MTRDDAQHSGAQRTHATHARHTVHAHAHARDSTCVPSRPSKSLVVSSVILCFMDRSTDEKRSATEKDKLSGTQLKLESHSTHNSVAHSPRFISTTARSDASVKCLLIALLRSHCCVLSRTSLILPIPAHDCFFQNRDGVLAQNIS